MRIIAGLLCVMLMVGCSEKDSIPSGVMGKEEMGSILWDMMQADQYATTYLIKDSSRVNVKMETLKLYEEIFRLHKVTREEFRKSFQFYQDHPDITRTLLDSLTARGNRMRSESYMHSPAAANSVPPARPATTVPAIHPPVTVPGRSAIMPNRPAGTIPGKTSGTVPNRVPGTVPNQPGSFRPLHGFPVGSDSFHRKGTPFLPGQHPPLPAGSKPFQPKDTTKH